MVLRKAANALGLGNGAKPILVYTPNPSFKG